MDLTRATAQEIGLVLDQAGVTWNYDNDGDVRIRFRSAEPPATDAVFYEFDTAKQDFSMRGQFLNARAVPQENGTTSWEVPADSVNEPTAVAQKVVSVYLMPRSGGVSIQIHASISPLDQPRPMHIKVISGSQQVSRIEREFPGFVGMGDDKSFWMSCSVTGTHCNEIEFQRIVRTASRVGFAMFDGPFTGWMYTSDV